MKKNVKKSIKKYNPIKLEIKKPKNLLIISLIVVIIVFLSISYVGVYLPNSKVARLSTENIIIESKTIELSSLTLEQKIAQMIMIRGDEKDLKFNNLNVGGIFLDRQKSEKNYKKLIKEYQDDSKIKLFVATDMEGAWTPFHNPEPHQIFPAFSEIKTKYEAEDIGFKHGELLKKIGFNMNFAPVSEYSDAVYGGRAFLGTDEEVADKVAFYIKGLQKNVLGVCKHYPGKGMQKNLHITSDNQEISKKDLYLFEVCKTNNISSIMVSHQIVTGEVNSNGKPSTVSKEVISKIDKELLVVSDEINMRGLSDFYKDKTKMYADLINSGENLILDFDLNSRELYKLIKEIKEEVKNGNIDESKIDESVTKILILKGYEVK
ncbi:MAG: beta-hexosaminidase [Candidatus Diapherotrites archaeon ADurb.Bin253]|nr:MAG: beta-hexosaminidase [Candidatus Diapherotrites archaeon ADurb.Bin253]